MKVYKTFLSDIFYFWVLFGIAVLIVYFLPTVFNWLFFVVIATVLLFNKKHTYFYLAFFFVLTNAPGDLFKSGNVLESRQLPFILLSAAGRISFIDIFPLLFFFKALSKNQTKSFFYKDFKILLIFFLIVFLISLPLGINRSNIYNVLVQLFSWSFLYSINKLVDSKELIKFDRLIFSIVIISFISQLSALFSGFLWLDLFRPSEYKYAFLLDLSQGEVARYISSAYIILYAFHKALYYILKREKNFNNIYLNIIISICMISIFLSATRGWILGLLIVTLLTFITFSNNKEIRNLLKTSFLGGLILLGLLVFSPSLQLQFINSFVRFESLEYIVKGDFTMGGDLRRVTERAPAVLSVYLNKPIIGWGFSNTYWENKDHHVGVPSILLNVGMAGLILFLFYFIKWVIEIIRVALYYDKSLIIFAFALLFFMVINLTSHQYWGFDLRISDKLALVLILSSFMITYQDIIFNNSKQ